MYWLFQPISDLSPYTLVHLSFSRVIVYMPLYAYLVSCAASNHFIRSNSVQVSSSSHHLSLTLHFYWSAFHALGAKYCVFSFPLVPGVSLFYLVVAVMVVGALWFGLWGVFSAYVGCVIGAGILSGLPS